MVNVFLVLIQARAVLDMFYDLLALEFVQKLDDIAFGLAKLDALGVTLRRACTAKCFRAEFEKQRFLGRTKHLGIFMKAIYFLNFCGFIVGLGFVSVRQARGELHCSSISVNFGDTIWRTPWVKTTADGQYEQPKDWSLVYSSFNGVYARNGTSARRPIYREMRKSMHHLQFEEDWGYVSPSEIKYCEEISGELICSY